MPRKSASRPATPDDDLEARLEAIAHHTLREVRAAVESQLHAILHQLDDGGGRVRPPRRAADQLSTDVANLAEELLSAKTPPTLRNARRRFELCYIDHVLNLCEGDRIATAEILDISLSALKEKLRAQYLDVD